VSTPLIQAATPYAASYVMLRKGNKVAFVLRTNTNWMNGYYGLTAGKVEQGESFLQAAIREAQEEAGVTVRADQLRHILTSYRYEGSTWIDIVFEATEWEGEAVNAEPHIHSELAWLDLDDLPENIIPSLRFMLEQIKAGKPYCEFGWDIEKTD
jgi:8-oxo-dGTP pyrophosphatase MutT (NUDIX family)